MTFNTYNEYLVFLKENPNFTGTCIVLHSNGKKRFEYNFVNGKQHGKQYCWYSDGQKWFKYNYVNDFQIGIQLYEGKTYEVKPEENNIWYIFVKETI